jgi:hypothetical protein
MERQSRAIGACSRWSGMPKPSQSANASRPPSAASWPQRELTLARSAGTASAGSAPARDVGGEARWEKRAGVGPAQGSKCPVGYSRTAKEGQVWPCGAAQEWMAQGGDIQDGQDGAARTAHLMPGGSPAPARCGAGHRDHAAGPARGAAQRAHYPPPS